LILNDERRARTIPRWRVRTTRAATAVAASVGVAAWGLTTGASYSLVSHFVHMRPMTAVQTTRPEVGVLVDAPSNQVSAVVSTLSQSGIQASLGLDRRPSTADAVGFRQSGDQVVPRLRGGGLVRWLGTRGQLGRLAVPIGHKRHFLYASSGPSIGQWWLAHGAGGRLVAGAVKLSDRDDSLGALRPGEVVEVTVDKAGSFSQLIAKLDRKLRAQHLRAVPVGRLMHDARQPG
jgi:hypothetical protein